MNEVMQWIAILLAWFAIVVVFVTELDKKWDILRPRYSR